MSKYLLLFLLVYPFSSAYAAAVKNVILLIGDGMGPQQISLGLIYARQSPNSTYKQRGLTLEALMQEGKVGFMLTYPKGALVVDSAASATQLATGHFAGSEMIGVDYQGNRQKTILEKAKAAGKATGLVSSTRITHATPAAFAAHQPHRTLENSIAEDLFASQPDVMLSAGLAYFLPKDSESPSSATYRKWRPRVPATIELSSSRADDIDLLSKAETSGYELVFSKDQLDKTKRKKILGLFASKEMPDGITEKQSENDSNRQVPTLKDMTQKALETLSQNKNGFFLMVEGGQIDWAGHANDTGTMLNEIIQFDKAIAEVLTFAKTNKDTLVILTADHETGSFGLSYSRNDVPKPKKLSGDAFQNSLFSPRFNFGDPNVLDKIYAQKKTFGQMLKEFDALNEDQQTPETLLKIANSAMEFTLTIDEAKAVLAEEKNDYRNPQYRQLSVETWPLIKDFKEYYVYGKGVRANLIGRAIAKEQQVVWGTGTHTTTAVPLVMYGPSDALQNFQGLMHSTDVNKAMTKSLGLK